MMNMRIFLVLVIFGLGGFGYWKYQEYLESQKVQGPPPSFAQQFDEALKDLKVTDLDSGKGKEASRGDRVTIHYEARLPDGKVFDSSKERKQPVAFQLGMAQALPAWDHGIEGMKVGGVRKVDSPAFLAYGRFGVDGVVPPDSPVTFEIQLVSLGDQAPAKKLKSKEAAKSKRAPASVKKKKRR